MVAREAVQLWIVRGRPTLMKKFYIFTMVAILVITVLYLFTIINILLLSNNIAAAKPASRTANDAVKLSDANGSGGSGSSVGSGSGISAAPDGSFRTDGKYEIYVDSIYRDSCETYDEAVIFAQSYERSSIREKGKSAWIWDNYPPYIVFLSSDDYSEFDTLKDAFDYARGTSRAYVYERKDSVLLWTNSIILKDSVLLKPPIINQLPELPRGCEVTSLAMLLSYRGVNVSKMTLADEVKKDTTPYRIIGGKINYGNPHNGFVGRMDTLEGNGLGVYNEPIEELLRKYVPDSTINLTGLEFEDLFYYLNSNVPVWIITNATFNRLPASEFETWHTADGPIEITYREHSVLVTGYDDNYIYFNDPYGYTSKAGRKGFIEAWKQMGRQAVTYLP